MNYKLWKNEDEKASEW